MELEKLRYPIGRFSAPKKMTPKKRKEYIKVISKYPKRLKKAVKNLSEDQLNTPYRPEGWTVRQVVNHVADSHINSYIRFRWTMTEDAPMIKAYDEKSWAELPDAKYGNIEDSLSILKGVHARWTTLLKEMSDLDYQRELGHPEWKENLSLNTMLALYVWHCEHHLAHITSLIEREGW